MTRTTISISEASKCACGCGQRTPFGSLVEQAAKGRTLAEGAEAAGIGQAYAATLVKTPRRFVQGHWRPDEATRLKAAARSAELSAQRRMSMAGTLLRSANDPTTKPRVAVRHLKQSAEFAAKAAELTAKASRLRQAALLIPRAEMAVVTTEIRKQFRVAATLVRQRDREQIDYLRNLVGQGWRQDSPPRDWNLVSLEQMREQNFGREWLPNDDLGMAEAALERRAANLILEHGALWLPSDLIGRALEGEVLAPEEQERMRDAYRQAEHVVLTGAEVEARQPAPPRRSLVPPSDAGAGLKRGRGRGRHTPSSKTRGGRARRLSGWSPGRYEGHDQIVLDRAVRALRREMAS